MIVVAGEALIDVLSQDSGTFTALPGGAPFNVARTIARLGGQCEFLGRLSGDGFGEQLRAALERVGVKIVVPAPTPAPTTLAIARLDDSGSALYSFYLEGTSAARLEPADIPADLFESSEVIALGGLGIVIEPTASTLLELIRRTPADVTVLLDPNCRPRAIRDLPAYRGAVNAFLARVDIVKVSVDDLALLTPGVDARDGARSLLGLGPAAVLVTDGSAPVLVHTATAEHSLPVPAVEVVDTIGAGDAFVAGFLTWWSIRSLRRTDVINMNALIEGTRAAIRVAAAACTVQGATLPAGFDWSASSPLEQPPHVPPTEATACATGGSAMPTGLSGMPDRDAR
jgi:fructokinase